MVIAYRIKGELENQGALILGSELYPLGQMLRGAMGYIFMEMGASGLKESYKNGNPVLYFRDCLVKCDGYNGCGKGYMMPLVTQDVIRGGERREKIVKETIYKCDNSKCGKESKENRLVVKDTIMNISISRDDSSSSRDGSIRSNSFANKVINEKKRFKFEVIMKGGKNKDVSQHLGELLGAIEYVKDNGIYFGRRKHKGLGKMVVNGDIEVEEIGMDKIVKRGEEIENIFNKNRSSSPSSPSSSSTITLQLISDYAGNNPISGEDICKEVKNVLKFFDPDWAEYRDSWIDPKVILAGKSIELDTDKGKSITFLDCKVEDNGVENMRFDTANRVISRGTRYNYEISSKIRSEFWNGLAMMEICRGLGDFTTFGKGQVIIS